MLVTEKDEIGQFKEFAIEQGCDMSEGAFDEVLDTIGRAKAEPAPRKTPREPLKSRFQALRLDARH
jgi:hypothetical protein